MLPSRADEVAARHPSGPLPVLAPRRAEGSGRVDAARRQGALLARPVLLGAGGAAIVVALVALVMTLTRGDGGGAPGGALASTQTVPLAGIQDFGRVRFSDSTRPLDTATLTAASLPPPPAGQQYEAWLIGEGGGSRRSLGLVQPAGNGGATVELRGGGGGALLTTFDGVEITVEPAPDADPRPSRTVAFSGELPAGALGPIRNLVATFDDTPGRVGLTAGLLRSATVVSSEAAAIEQAQRSGDLAGMRRHAEVLANLVEGPEGASYGDTDGDGTIAVAGDGYGLLQNGRRLGYVPGALQEARAAAAAPDATPNVQAHAGHVAVTAENLAQWSQQVRDLALTVAASTTLADAGQAVSQVGTLGRQILDGTDANGDGAVDAIAGEGGARTLYEHAQYMADMQLVQA
jgi:hypothetical protein